MSGYGGPELANAFRTVRKNTVQVARDIPEDQYEFVAAPGVLSVSTMLRHLIYSPRLHEDMHRERRLATLEGYDFGATLAKIGRDEQIQRSKAEIIELLESEGERIAAWLESTSPEFLAETFAGTGGQATRTRLEGLLSIKEHEMHHRGQLMLIERLLGIVPHFTREREARRQRASQPATAAS